MSDYTFANLAPYEFEDLCKDLLEVHLPVKLQAFTTGRDGGIDIRHAPIKGQDWIVQCKHYASSSFSTLKTAVEKELPKLKHLNPERYVLATSRGLSPGNVDTLFNILSPYCKSKHDIVDRTELNAILRKKRSIVQQHPKLWVTSEAVLSRVLHNDIFVQTALTRDEIQRRLSLYVVTDQLKTARKKLNDERVCIISGIPGVGKTTLAEMLIIEYLQDNWELVSIQQNVSEGLKILREHPDTKQIFYYDDFLGRISIGEKLGKNEDAVLLQLIREIHNSQNKLFILTTREYILAQAKQQHERLNRADIEPYGLVVECSGYNEDAKARMLANHLYFNKVPQEFIATIVLGKGYTKLLTHMNYSPRLVESMTSRLSIRRNTAETYLSSCVELLNNPALLWEDAFEQQLSEPARQLLIIMVTCSTPVNLIELESDFEVFYQEQCRKNHWPRSTIDFERALNELEGNFITIHIRGDRRLVDWHNPSVLDFLDRWLRAHRRTVENMLIALQRFSQLQQLITTTPILIETTIAKKVINLSQAVLLDTVQRLSKDEQLSWEELSAAMLLCDSNDNEELRGLVIQLLNKSITAAEFYRSELVKVIKVLKLASEKTWLPNETKNFWNSHIKLYLLSGGEEVVDDSQHLIQIAAWLTSTDGAMTPSEQELFTENVKAFLDSYVWSSFSPDSRQLWESIKEEIEEFEVLLDCTFDRAKLHVESNIEEAEEQKTQQGPVSYDLLKTYMASDVSSIFDALLE